MMELKRWGFVVFCLICISVLMPGGFGGRQRTGELLLGLGVSSQDVDEAMVGRLWRNCGLDPLNINNVVKGLYVSILRDINSDSAETNLKLRSLMKVGTQEADTFIKCMRKQDLQFRASGQGDNSRNMFVDYQESRHSWDPAARRHLAGQPFQVMVPHAAPPPSSLSPGPSPHLASVPSPSPVVGSPILPPAPAFDMPPERHPTHDDRSPAPSPGGKSNSHGESLNSAPVAPPNAQSNSNKTIIIAVTVTAVGTSIFTALLFCCYIRCCKKDYSSGASQRDDRPLLALSLSDFSGSSQKSYGFGGSINGNKLGSLSFKMSSNQGGRISSFNDSLGGTPAPGVVLGISESEPGPPNVQTDAAAPKPPPPAPAPTVKNATPPPVPPPPVPPPKPGPRPPPPPKNAIPRPPPKNSIPSRAKPPAPPGPDRSGDAASSRQSYDDDASGSKTKLKPFFWEKVLANPDDSMVWHQIKAGSFQFNEEMIESLFGYNSADKSKNGGNKVLKKINPANQYIQLLEPKKSQNLAISLKAMGVKVEEVSEALMEGNELPSELLQILLRMSPTDDEEFKLRVYNGDLSLLGPAEQFLKVLVDIPFAFKRMDALSFMASLSEDTSTLKDAFESLEVACKELRSSRLFRKLLEAVLKTGNRMNVGTFRGGADAFKLDTLLKLSDVKGTDGKTTLLHFVVQEIIRSEGVRAARMAREQGSISNLTISSLGSFDLTEDPPQENGDYYQTLGLKVVSVLSTELDNVKKAATLDSDVLMSTAANLGHRLVKAKEFLNTDMKSLEEQSGFHRSLKSFVEHAESDIVFLLEEEKRIRSLVKSTTDYFHGNAGKDEGLRLFVIVRDFLGMVDKACKEVKESSSKIQKQPKTKEDPAMTSLKDHRQRLFPAIRDRRVDSSSSSDEDS
ncbi:putative formin, FH2 domain-containing protein [Dioscorea sansibarensis]